MKRNYSKAASLCRKLLSDSTAAPYRKKALSLLFGIFQASGDTGIVNDLSNYASSKSNFGVTASLLLASADAAIGKLSKAASIDDMLKVSYPNSDIEKQALFMLASLGAYNPAYESKSKAAVKELLQKYGSNVDAGIMAALGVSVNNNPHTVQSKLQGQKAEKINADTLKYKVGNFPNPFNPTTTISYQLPKEGYVTLKVYDMLGREVRTLVNGMRSPGIYTVQFNGTDLASGVYIYSLQVRPAEGGKGFTAVKKLMLLK